LLFMENPPKLLEFSFSQRFSIVNLKWLNPLTDMKTGWFRVKNNILQIYWLKILQQC